MRSIFIFFSIVSFCVALFCLGNLYYYGIMMDGINKIDQPMLVQEPGYARAVPPSVKKENGITTVKSNPPTKTRPRLIPNQTKSFAIFTIMFLLISIGASSIASAFKRRPLAKDGV